MRKITIQELREKKRRIKRKMRIKRRELLQLEEDLHNISTEQKALKQLDQGRKFRSLLLARARNGELRLCKDDILNIMEKL